MKRIVILGAGTGGTMMAQHLNKEVDKKTVVNFNSR
jgi:NADH dehydrogenase FAD-containing subunit